METYKNHVRLLCVYFRNCDIENIKLEEVIEYIKIMKDVGFDQNSFIGKCSAYKQFFTFFQKQGIKVPDPEMIPIPRGEYKFPKMLEEGDYKKLLAALEKHPKNIHSLKNKTLLRILWDTGVRLNELLSMKTEDMDLQLMRTVIKTEKSRSRIKPVRMVFWTKETNVYLRDYIKARKEILEKTGFEDKEGYLFIGAHYRWKMGSRWSDTAVEAMLKRLSIDANLGYTANPHRFRHHFGKTLAIRGANQSVIADMMGHANIENTRIYTVMNEKMMQDTYKKYFKH